MAALFIEPAPDVAELLIAAVLREHRARRPECEWLAAHDFAGTGRCVIVPVLPAAHPAVYDTWPWSGLAGFQRTRRELRALGFDQVEAR
jgi:hypothetical protein